MLRHYRDVLVVELLAVMNVHPILVGSDSWSLETSPYGMLVFGGHRQGAQVVTYPFRPYI